MKLRLALILDGIRKGLRDFGEFYGDNFVFMLPLTVFGVVPGIPLFVGAAITYGFWAAVGVLLGVMAILAAIFLLIRGVIWAFSWAEDYSADWRREEREAAWRRQSGEA